MRFLPSLVLLIASLVVSLFLGEWVLGGLGYPTEAPVRAAHPPGFVETRESIEFRYQFATNSGGLRYSEISRERSPNTHRVLVLGDSYTEGQGVEAHDRFTNRVERSFELSGQKIAFVNGGLSGTGPRHYAVLLKHVGLSYEPNAVLVCLYANDLANTPEDPDAVPIDPAPPLRTGVSALASRWWPRLYTILGGLKASWQYRRRTSTTDFIGDLSARARRDGVEEPRIEAWIESLPMELVDAANEDMFGASVLANGLIYPEYWTDSLDVDSQRSEAKWQNMVAALDTIVSMAERERASVAVVFLPVHFQYDPDSHLPDNIAIRTGTAVRREWLTGKSEAEKRLAKWTAGRDIPFVSLTEVFRAAVSQQTAPLDYKFDGHWTPLGHDVAARALELWLRNGGVFSFIPPASGQIPN